MDPETIFSHRLAKWNTAMSKHEKVTSQLKRYEFTDKEINQVRDSIYLKDTNDNRTCAALECRAKHFGKLFCGFHYELVKFIISRNFY